MDEIITDVEKEMQNSSPDPEATGKCMGADVACLSGTAKCS
ncbi:uncharacterized protein RSE6_02724 [Rhynchosporium secalis]|uniref:Uncharacterized protein n=1 Tax=Rhynchosporium secalis TaxID=38038 RepID=A0A1E1M0Z5_RHYSE|nr:uncharacterized protein RSE6_02724 [Rhynchosporium secalis]